MAKAKRNRPANYEDKIKLAETVKFEDLVKVAAKSAKKPKLGKK